MDEKSHQIWTAGTSLWEASSEFSLTVTKEVITSWSSNFNKSLNFQLRMSYCHGMLKLQRIYTQF